MLFERLSELFTSVISSTGYFGIFILMTLESMVAPVPSELVMPFAGFLVADGKLSLWLVVVVSTLASITGSLLSYFIAYFGEKELIHKFGSRFIPVIRHLISIPAGLARMDLKRFILFTAVGATAWNSFLLWVGIQLRERWQLVEQYSKPLDVIMVVLIVVAVGYYAYKHLKKKVQ
ncbi:DedA family protein [Candidatus Woesearchaeota archaeon]|nr:DedA family protein [Candidatus Woesearchaeota archaeon]